MTTASSNQGAPSRRILRYGHLMLALSALLASPTLAQSPLADGTFVVENKEKGELNIIRTAESVELEARVLTISYDLPGGRHEEADVTILFHRDTGWTWWTYRGRGEATPENPFPALKRRFKFVFGRDGITAFVLGFHRLLVRESAGIFSTFDEAQAEILRSAQEEVGKVAAGLPSLYRLISLTPCIPREFFYPHRSSAVKLVAEITEVSKEGDGWRLELHGTPDRMINLYLDWQFEIERIEGLSEDSDSSGTCKSISEGAEK